MFPDAVYHVTSRGNRRQDIFIDDFDRRDFLDRLGRASVRYNLRIHAFCLMSNHYHLFLRTPEPNLADAMRWINSGYALRLNRRHRQSGHVLQGRYKAALVIEQAHWINLSFYVHLNPVLPGSLFPSLLPEPEPFAPDIGKPDGLAHERKTNHSDPAGQEEGIRD